MPPALIERANAILKQLEDSREGGVGNEDTTIKAAKNKMQEAVKQLNTPQMQLSIFDAHSQTFDDIRKVLDSIDINRLTPVEALLKLQEIKDKVK